MSLRWAPKLALQALRYRALRSWICAWTISAAVCAILVTRGLTVGAAARAEDVLLALADQHIVVFDGLGSSFSQASLDAQAAALQGAGVAQRLDVLCAVFVDESDPIPFQICGLSSPMPQLLGEMLALEQGAWPKPGTAELILERNLADRWQRHVGSHLAVFPRQPPMTLSGRFVRRAQFATPDALTALDTLQRLRKRPGQLSLSLLVLRPGVTAAQAEAAVQAALPDLRVLQPEVLRARLHAATQPLALAGAAHSLFIGLLCGLICLFALWSSVHERRNELALLRVLGYPRRTLLATVLLEGGVIGAIGAAKGALLGVAVLAGLIPQLHPGLGGRVIASEVLLAMGLGVLLALLGALAPALHASRAPPQELLT